uniref:ATPase AAA-type core domain-containing protein n=1 Tax=Globisporangium ultimum (strain ATCC 200006 / CBS 805.95 / DAOM BR144) TaxID=431595 RepID=K3WG58_GLOUD
PLIHRDIPKIGHFVFRGSLGTGKTTVARAIAKIFHRMDILATDKLVETSGLDLTDEKVETQLGEARGRLLCIDEAYELGKGHFGAEAMMNPTYADMVIIITGYPRNLDDMLDRNAGLKSCFTRFVNFYDWKTEDRLKFAVAKSENDGYTLSPRPLSRCTARSTPLPMFDNGHDAVQLWSEMLDCRAQRVQFTPEIVKTISFKDTDAAGQTFIAGWKPASGPLMHQTSPSSGPIAMGSDFAHAPTHHRQTIHQDSKASEEPMLSVKTEETAKDEDKWSDAERDPGVSDDTWAGLQRAKQERAAMLKALKEAVDERARKLARQKLKLEQAKQEKLCRVGKCPMGYVWLPTA